MAKVLISLVGTGKQASGDNINNRYVTTDYILDGKLYKEKVFTSNVIIEHYNINKVYFIGTIESMWDNLIETFSDDENYMMKILEKKDEKTLKESDLEKLGLLIDQELGGNGSKCYLVKDGENEKELWAIFEKFLEILSKIEKDDEVYFDVTHLFRSVSLMSFVIAELGQIAFDMKIAGMFYGMLKKNEPSKIINIKMLFEYLEWAKAFEELDKFASLNRLVKLSRDKLSQTVSFSILERMKEAFNIANMSAIHKEIQRLKTHIKYFKENENYIIKILSPRLEEFINKFDKKSLGDFQFVLAEFFAERNNSALGYIALAEAIITKIGEKKGLKDGKLFSKEERDKIKTEIREGFNKSIPYNHPKRKFAQLFAKINDIRNNIAHQLENSKHAKHDIENLQKYIKDAKKYIKEIY